MFFVYDAKAYAFRVLHKNASLPFSAFFPGKFFGGRETEEIIMANQKKESSELEKYLACLKAEKNAVCGILSGEERTRAESEAILPDYKESVGRVLYTNARIIGTRCETYRQGDAVCCDTEGECIFNLIYLSEGKDPKISSFSHSVPFKQSFRQTFDAERCDIDKIRKITESRAENVSCRLLGPRKMIFKCDVVTSENLIANVREGYYPRKSSCLFPGGFYTRTVPLVSTEIVNVIETDGVLKESVRLPAEYGAIDEILDVGVSICAVSSSADRDRITVNGAAEIVLLYTPDSPENKDPVSVCQPIDFTLNISTDGLAEKDVCESLLECASVKSTLDIDEYGESRVVNFEIGYFVESAVMRTTAADAVSDCFSDSAATEVTSETVDTAVLAKLFCDTEETLFSFVPKRAGLCDIAAISARCDIKSCSILSEGDKAYAVAEAEMTASYFGFSSDREGVHDEEKKDVTLRMEIPGGAELSGKDVTVEIVSSVLGCEGNVSDGEVSVRATVVSAVRIYCKAGANIARSVTVSGEREDASQRRIVFFYPDKNDDIWSVAKRYGVSPEELAAENPVDEKGNLRDVVIITPRRSKKVADAV